MQSVYVQARDGAFYKDPLFVFEEGFLCFDDDDPPELILWIPEKVQDAEWHPANALAKVVQRFGDCLHVTTDDLFNARHSERVIPGTEPFQFRQAASLFVKITGRTPRPTKSDGSERYKRNCPGRIYAWPARPKDVYGLDLPQ